MSFGVLPFIHQTLIKDILYSRHVLGARVTNHGPCLVREKDKSSTNYNTYNLLRTRVKEEWCGITEGGMNSFWGEGRVMQGE